MPNICEICGFTAGSHRYASNHVATRPHIFALIVSTQASNGLVAISEEDVDLFSGRAKILAAPLGGFTKTIGLVNLLLTDKEIVDDVLTFEQLDPIVSRRLRFMQRCYERMRAGEPWWIAKQQTRQELHMKPPKWIGTLVSIPLHHGLITAVNGNGQVVDLTQTELDQWNGGPFYGD